VNRDLDEDRRKALEHYPTHLIRHFAPGEDSPEARRHRAKKTPRNVSAKAKAHVARGVHRRKQLEENS